MFSDVMQKATLLAAKDAILHNIRPSVSERQMHGVVIDQIIARIDKAAGLRVASQKEQQADVGEVYREERARR